MARRLAAAAIVVIAWCASARAEPSSTVIVVDRSAAMKGERIELVRAAVRDVIENVPAGDRVAVVGFAKRASVVVPLGAAAPKRVEPAIAKLDADASFDENMAAGLELAGTLLVGKGVRHVVLISNTEATIGATHATTLLHDRGITLSTIAVQSDGHSALEDLAKRGRGLARVVDDLVELRGALDDASAPPDSSRAHVSTFVVFAIDRSISMMGEPLERTKRAIADTVRRLPADDIVAIVAFDTDALVMVQPTIVTHRDQITNELSPLRPAGGTNIFAALATVTDLFVDDTTHDKRVVVITDGGGPSDGVAEACEALHNRGIRIDAIGLPSADRNLLTTMTKLGNGKLEMIDDLNVWPKLLPP